MAARVIDPETVTAPHRFRESYSAWTGRAWLHLEGPEPAVVPIGPAYGAVRRRLRDRFADRPWDTEWADGPFPAAPWGLPLGPVVVCATVAAVGAVAGAGAALGPAGSVGVVLGCSWPLARLFDAVEVGPRGVRIGPPWALRTPWHRVEAVGICGRSVWVKTRDGGGRVDVPVVLVPALRARIRRFHGPPRTDDGGLDLRYARWVAAARGIPWGVGAAVVATAWSRPDPWLALAGGGVVTLGLALLGGAVEARASGWGTGAVIALSLLFAMLSTLLAFAGS